MPFSPPTYAPWPTRENLDVFLSVVLDHTKREIQESVQAGRINPDQTSLWQGGLALGRTALRLSPYHAEALHARLVELTREFTALQSDSRHGAIQSYELLIGIYPTLAAPMLPDNSDTA